MTRLGRLNLALALLLLLPTVASAQRDSRYTREASKFIGLAMTRQDPAARTDMYRQAMEQLRQGMQDDANNAKVWLLAGTVLAALGEMTEADQAFVKAVQMHPDYAEEIATEREAAWIDAFNHGIGLMDQQRYDEAVAALEAAQVIYKQRPEALMNLGALYANSGQHARAITAFEEAIEATKGPLFAQLDEEQRESWVRFRDMATLNIAQLAGAAGVDAFQAERYDEAYEHFHKASGINPHSRDYLFNQVQSLWAQAARLEDVLEEGGAAAEAAKRDLAALYPRIVQLAQQTRTVDPNSEVLYLIEARSNRMIGDLRDTAAERDVGHQAALKVLEQHELLPIALDDILIIPETEGATIQGRLKNRKLAEGAPVQIEFTLLGIDGSTIGQHTVTVTAPAADEEKDFEVAAPMNGELAGWRYTVK
jgi:tetratricopeptide (TPR) repeat protein